MTEIFSIAPPAGRAMWLVLVIPGLVVAFVAGLLTMTVVSSRTARFEISPEGLRLRGDLYGRLIPADQLRRGAARRVDFTASPELRPQRRTMGTGLPGYRAGWFRLRNGEKALLYLTDASPRSTSRRMPGTASCSVPRSRTRFSRRWRMSARGRERTSGCPLWSPARAGRFAASDQPRPSLSSTSPCEQSTCGPP